MGKLIFRTDNKTVIFDDFVDDTKDYRQYWVGICPCCKNKFGSLLNDRIDENAADGLCSVEGCENEAEYCVDFDMEEVEIVEEG